MTEQTPEVEPTDEDLPPYFRDPDDYPRSTRPEDHLEPEEDD